MAYICICGDELTVHTTKEDVTTYCQSCGAEKKTPNQKQSITNHNNVVSISRASILKRINKKTEEETKRPRQIRDRVNYMHQRGRGR